MNQRSGQVHRKVARRASLVLSWLLVLGSAGYASLPLWFPCRWFARQLADRLEQELGLPVRLTELQISWLRGVTVRELTIGDKGGGGVHLHIRQVNCPLTPLRMLVTGRVPELEIDRPHILLDLSGAEPLSWKAFGEGAGSVHLPSYNYVLHHLACRVRTSGGEETIRVDRLEARLDPPSGSLRLHGEVRVDPQPGEAASELRRLNLSAHALLPRLNPSFRLRGRLRLEWTSLTLADLPLGLIPDLPIEQVRGTTSGTLTLEAQPDLGVDYALSLELKGVGLRHLPTGRAAMVPDALLSCAGHWDPATDLILLHGFEVRTPGIHLTGHGSPDRPALLWDLDGINPCELHLSGTIRDWQKLRAEIPPLEHALQDRGLLLTGSAGIRVDVSRRYTADHLRFSADLTAAGCRWTTPAGTVPLDAGPTVDKNLTCELNTRRGDVLRAEGRLSLKLGPASLRLDGGGPVPADWLEDRPVGLRRLIEGWLQEGVVDLSWECREVESMLALLPAAGRRLGEIPGLSWTGPARLSVRVHPVAGGMGLRVIGALPVGSTCRYADWIAKPPERALGFDLETVVPWSSRGEVNGWRCSLSYDRAQAHFGGRGAELHYELAPGSREGMEEAGLRRILETLLSDSRLLSALRTDFRVTLQGVEKWLSLSPVLAGRLEEKQVSLSGDAAFRLQHTSTSRPGDLLAVTRLEYDLSTLQGRAGDVFTHSRGRPMRGSISHRLTRHGQRAEHFIIARAENDSMVVHLGGGWEPPGGGPAALSGAWTEVIIRDGEGLLEQWPVLRRLLADTVAGGDATFNGELVCLPSSSPGCGPCRVRLEVDATGMEVRHPGEAVPFKPRGIPCRMSLEGEVATTDEAAGCKSTVEVKRANAELGDLLCRSLGGRLVWEGNWPGPAGEVGLPGGWGPRSGLRLLAASVNAQGSLRFGEQFRRLGKAAADALDRFALAGAAAWQALAEWDGHRWRGQARLAGDELTWDVPTGLTAIPRWIKRPGEPFAAKLEGEIERGDGDSSAALRIDDMQVSAGANTARISGTARLLRTDTRRWSLRQAEIQTRLQIPQAEVLLTSLPGSVIEQIEGGIDLEAGFIHTGEGLAIRSGTVRLDDLRFSARTEPVFLDGQVRLGSDRLQLDPLNLRWGPNDVSISGGLGREPGGPQGRLALNARKVDIPWIMQAARETARRWGMEDSSSTPAEPDLRRLFAELARADLRVDTYADTLRVLLPPSQLVEADALSMNLAVDRGVIRLTFAAAVAGGTAAGEVTSDTRVPEPTYYLRYRAENLQPGPLVDSYLRQTFPGMTATGPLTLIDETTQKIFPAPGEPNHEVGEGELVIQGGYVVGRAAPLWMTNIFPGLNLSRYDFSYMHSWFKKTVDGRIRHQMIYQGAYYNIYMIGYSGKDHRFEYEVGIDFLADFDSRYWAESGQGRIPLFVKSGRLADDGSLLEENISFASPQRTLETWLLSNNPAVTAYHAVRKRVLGEE